jgi:hypothetical protein
VKHGSLSGSAEAARRRSESVNFFVAAGWRQCTSVGVPQCEIRPSSYRWHMPRRGQVTRNAVRRAQREAAKALESQQGSYEPPKGSAPSKQWEMPYDDSNTVRLQFFLWRDGGKIVNFVINVQVITAEGWTTVEYFDCCHGNCHLHPANDGV